MKIKPIKYYYIDNSSFIDLSNINSEAVMTGSVKFVKNNHLPILYIRMTTPTIGGAFEKIPNPQVRLFTCMRDYNFSNGLIGMNEGESITYKDDDKISNIYSNYKKIIMSNYERVEWHDKNLK